MLPVEFLPKPVPPLILTTFATAVATTSAVILFTAAVEALADISIKVFSTILELVPIDS